MPHTLSHVLPVTARVNDAGHLEIGGRDTVDLVTEFGTPLFVFCEDTFRTRVRQFTQAFPQAKVYYAAKAFQSLAISRIVAEEGLGMDVASGGELHVALTAGFPPERLVFHGNNKLDTDLEKAIEVGIGRVVIDSLEEVDRVSRFAGAAGRRQEVFIRVTPGVEAHTHHYIQTGQEDSKFGLSVEGGLALKAIEITTERDSLDLKGIHAHIGSNIFSFDPYAKTIEVLFELIAQAKERFGASITEVNLGGGFGIPYVAGDYPAQLDLLSKMVNETAAKEASRLGIEAPELGFEPGRFLIGNAMLTLYRVGAIKEVPGIRTYVSVDGGMSDNIRPALYEARYAAILANKARHEPTRAVTVAGMHCESGDILLRDIALPESIERGDVLAVPATGAYGYSMASNYNMQPRPAMVMVNDGEAKIIIRRETFDDLVRLHELP